MAIVTGLFILYVFVNLFMVVYNWYEMTVLVLVWWNGDGQWWWQRRWWWHCRRRHRHHSQHHNHHHHRWWFGQLWWDSALLVKIQSCPCLSNYSFVCKRSITRKELPIVDSTSYTYESISMCMNKSQTINRWNNEPRLNSNYT